MGYLNERMTFERWIWIGGLLAGLIVGFSLGARHVNPTEPVAIDYQNRTVRGSVYTAGYADGRSQAHQDIEDYCDYKAAEGRE